MFKGRLKRKQSRSFGLPIKLCTLHPLNIHCCRWDGKLFLYLQQMDVSLLVFQYATIGGSSKIITCCFGCLGFFVVVGWFGLVFPIALLPETTINS